MTAVKFDNIHDALVARGFRQAPTIQNLAYCGVVQVGDEPVEVRLDIPDPELQQLPIIRLIKRPAWVLATCNHVSPDNIICYANSRLAFVDRYQADRQILYCIDRAEIVLRDIRRGHVLADVDQEFAYYWNGRQVFVDIDSASATHWLDVLTVRLADQERCVIVDRGQDGREKYAAFVTVEQAPITAIILPGDRTPPADSTHWPPTTLQNVIVWLRSADPRLLKSFRLAIGGLNGKNIHRALFLFQTDPTWFGIGFARPTWIPTKFRHPGDFANAFERRSADIPVERFIPIRVDSRYLVERNLRDGEKSLLGKRILLAGCGAIGGHLAHALARSGAGFGSGMLLLADREIYLGGNVGRHRLGIESLLLPKVEALCRDLRRALPGIDVRARQASALDLPLLDFDLVIDATGEEQLSEALNGRFLSGDCPPVVFTWVVGNGVAAQSFTLASRDQGCLHCWKSHGDRSSFIPADVNRMDIRVGRGCDDPYVPFNGAAPLAAASLALQAILDWVSGHPNPTLRTVQLDYQTTHHIKPKTPAKTPACLACGQLH